MVPIEDGQQKQRDRLLQLSYVPMATTCAMYEGRLITDPDAEEESLAASTVTSIMDGAGSLIGAELPLMPPCMQPDSLHA